MVKRNLYIIPDPLNIEESVKLSEQYNTGFEYNDFFFPALLDDEVKLKERINIYKSLNRPSGRDNLHGVFFDICLNSADAKIKQISEMRMRSSMEIAMELGCKGVIFHTNIIPGFETETYLEGWEKMNALFYEKLCEEYSELNIYVENMFDYKPDMLAKLGKRMDSHNNFGICYDVAHGHVHDVSVEDWMKALAPYIKHLHINDNDGKADLHMPVGSGTLDWEKYFKLLNEMSINADLLIEVNGKEKQVESLKYLEEKGFI